MRVFLDTNVVMDVMARREPFFGDSLKVLSLMESGVVEGFIAAHTASTLFYLLKRSVGAKRARAALLDLLRIVSVVAVDQDRILQALAMDWEDFEDALQAACAAKTDVDFFLTRDQRGFSDADVPVLSPAGFLALQGGQPG